jgi:hypothetical protein
VSRIVEIGGRSLGLFARDLRGMAGDDVIDINEKGQERKRFDCSPAAPRR